MGQGVSNDQVSCSQQQQACGCLPAGPLSNFAAECRGDGNHRRSIEEIGVAIDNFETDGSSSDGSEGSDSLSHLKLARSRVFTSHTRARFHDHYRIDKMLGEGSYGNVFEAVSHSAMEVVSLDLSEQTELSEFPREVPRRVAAKCFALTGSAPREGETEMAAAHRRAKEAATRRASFEKERAILARIEHPHIIRIFEVFEEPDHLWIVMELCRGGELYETIADRVRKGYGAGIEESTGKILYRQMVHAMSYLQSCRIVHRDVKTENFLLLGAPGTVENSTIKLCDFGTAVRLSDDYPRAMERIGTLSYTAPEIYGKLGCCTLADVWSLGVVLYVLLVGASPFRITGEEPRQETIERIMHARFDKERLAWHNLSEAARQLICSFLVVEENARISYKEVLKHAWLETGLAPSAKPKTGPASRRFVSPRADHEGRFLDLAPLAAAAWSLLLNFARLDTLQKMVLTLCAQMIPEVEHFKFKHFQWYDLFFALDTSQDGRLDVNEFTQGMKALLTASTGSASEELLEEVMEAVDLDGSGYIEWAEWVTVPLVASPHVAIHVEPLATVFRVLDRPSYDQCLGVADLLSVATIGLGHDTSSSQARDCAVKMLSRWASATGGPTNSVVALSALEPSRLTLPSGGGPGQRSNCRDYPNALSSHHSRRRQDPSASAAAAAAINGGTNGSGSGTPLVSAADLRRMLAKIRIDEQEGQDWHMSRWSAKAGFFGCCQTDGPTVVQKGLPRAPSSSHFTSRQSSED
mmetsp:Transcript_43424/g.93020  ORF Transcript_43424/g.93020 Transcript_43424/m.93020 type:complete len:752 (-) Transcript_43424:134-2389(-)